MKTIIDIARFLLSVTVGASALWFTEWLYSIPITTTSFWQGLAFFIVVPMLFSICNSIREGKYF